MRDMIISGCLEIECSRSEATAATFRAALAGCRPVVAVLQVLGSDQFRVEQHDRLGRLLPASTSAAIRSAGGDKR
ncbi:MULTISPECIES: hypothetical protein [unclassified Bradyrhizobium]